MSALNCENNDYQPCYPQAIIDEIIQTSQVNAQSSLLEIGAGSGKVTERFLPLKCHITCVEPDETLARLGLVELNVDGNITYKIGRFEDIDLFDRTYDLIFSAQVFHRVERPSVYDKIEKLLNPKGHLALLWTLYVNIEDAQHTALSTLCKDYGIMYFQNNSELAALKTSWIKELLECNYFQPPIVIEIPWTETQDLDDYMNFLKTRSTYLKLSVEDKLIFDSQVAIIFGEYENKLTRTYNSTLYLAKKK